MRYLHPPGRRGLIANRGERHADLTDLLERDPPAGEDRPRLKDSPHRGHHVEDRQNIAGHGLRVVPGAGRGREEQAAEKTVEEDLVPRVGDEMAPDSGERVLPQVLRRGGDPLREKGLPPRGVQLQLLHPLRQRAEVVEEEVTGVARPLQGAVGARGQEPVSDHADYYDERHGDQGRGGEPPEVHCAAEHHRRVHRHRRNVLGGPAEPGDIVGERRQDPWDPHVLEVAERRRQHLTTEVTAELGQGPLRESVEQQARQGLAHHLGRDQPHESRDEQTPRGTGVMDRRVDQSDQPCAGGAAHEARNDGRAGHEPRAGGNEREEEAQARPEGGAICARSRQWRSCVASAWT